MNSKEEIVAKYQKQKDEIEMLYSGLENSKFTN